MSWCASGGGSTVIADEVVLRIFRGIRDDGASLERHSTAERTQSYAQTAEKLLATHPGKFTTTEDPGEIRHRPELAETMPNKRVPISVALKDPRFDPAAGVGQCLVDVVRT